MAEKETTELEDISEKTVTPAAPPDTSPPWGRTAKTVVAVATLLLVVAIVQRFQSLITQVIVAAILAYVLNPLINFIDKKVSLKRSVIILLAYITIAIAVIWATIGIGVIGFQQINDLIEQTPTLISRTTTLFEQVSKRTEPITFLTFSIDPSNIPWEAIRDQLLGLTEPILRQSGQMIGQVATTTIRWVGILFFVFIVSIYMAIELPQLGGYVVRLANFPGYGRDAERLMKEFVRIWQAYLRGQVLLGTLIGTVSWLGLSILGVNNALALGLLSGVLELVPNIGPIIGAVVAVVVAFFQPENYLGLPAWQFALVVLALMIIIQQVENNLLVPRIMGQALDLHPLLVIIGVLMGGTIAGILGAILAAPVLASLKLVGIYAWRKMFDLPPFPEPEEEKEEPAKPPIWQRIWALSRRNKPPATSE